jgi:hypothetical protein
VKPRLAVLAAVVASAGALAACASAAPATTTQGSQEPVAASPLATSLTTTKDTWAVVLMGGSAASEDNFWQVFVRPATSSDWKLVTPPGVADNGGLVAAGTGGSLTVAFRPSQDLTFSPLATSTNGGAAWGVGLLDANIAPTPDALAASGSQLLALLANGTLMTSSNAGSSWRTLAGAGAIADSATGAKCGALGVTDVSFGTSQGEVLAAGTCGAAGTGVFTYSSGAWHEVSLPVSGRVVRMMPGVALVADGARLYAAWDTASGWQASAPLAAGSVEASGSLAPGGAGGAGGSNGADGADGAWVLLPGGRAATIAGPGQPWRSLPSVPQGTSVLAAGPGGSVDALTVSGSQGQTLTVWRLAGSAAAWSKVQAINVPLQFGSSS